MMTVFKASMAALGMVTALTWASASFAEPDYWKHEWRKTDFSKHSIPYSEIRSGGPPKDGIPPIDDPKIVPISEVTDIGKTEPVVGLVINGEAVAYSLRILMWHEIVNDTVAGVPVAITFCPLCNAAIVFDRRLEGKVLDFGTTGKLRKSDLVMYDRQTESWWQQFLGEGIVGEMTGKRLKILPSRLESWENFKARAPQGKVLAPNVDGMRDYGSNPYTGYDSLARPFLYDGETPKGVAPLGRVVSLNDKSQAWSLEYLRQKREVRLSDGTVINWTKGQNSALDTEFIHDGKDVGNVTVQKNGEDIAYFVDFAFAFHAYYPKATLHTK
ncbi:MAG: hypothetical protein ACJAU6_000888 [Alphaproteobacteria bacterium]|jgi:hypothetical protein